MYASKSSILNIHTAVVMCITCLTVMLSTTLYAQQTTAPVQAFETQSTQTFRAGLIGGFNATQVDGDNLGGVGSQTGGFDKAGLHIGVAAELPFKKQYSFAVEILFSQKGASSTPDWDLQNPTLSYRFKTNYAEVPLLFEYYIKPRVCVSAGVSVAKLVHVYESIGNTTQINTSSVVASGLSGAIHNIDYEAILDLHYFLTLHWVADLRYSYSIVPYAYSYPVPGNYFYSSYVNHGQYNNVITIAAMYMFGKRRSFSH